MVQYEVVDGKSVTPCPFDEKIKGIAMFDLSDHPEFEGRTVKVGSCACRACEHYDPTGRTQKGVKCKRESLAAPT